MKCSIRNFNDFDFNGDTSSIVEVIYDYNKNDMVEMLKITKPDKTVCLNLPYDLNDSDIQSIKELSEVRPNVKFIVKNELIEGVPCFCARGYFDADNLDKLNILCEKGVTDVYIAGQLGFNMRDARVIADNYGVKLRAVPNIASLSNFTLAHKQKYGNCTAFWIRPEDLELYNNYIDIVEFAGQDEKQSTFYEIYFQEKKWEGDLGIIIAGLGYCPNNLLSDFTEARLNCGKKCILDKCHSCYKYTLLANLMNENGVQGVIESI